MQVFITLLAAHVLADFVFQTDLMIRHKKTWWVIALHILSVTLLSAILLGTANIIALAVIALTHLLFDLWKTHLSDGSLWAFSIDQAGHVLVIAMLSVRMPGLYAEGFWSAAAGAEVLGYFRISGTYYLTALTLLTGFIVTTKVGALMIELMFRGFAIGIEPKNDGLVRGGRYIGYLERSLVFFLMLNGHIGTIGFLIAAKSFLRIGSSSLPAMEGGQAERASSEYVIIGTLASFGWALVVTRLTQTALKAFV